MTKQEPAPSGGRGCKICNRPLPEGSHFNTRYCSADCRKEVAKKVLDDWRKENPDKRAKQNKRSFATYHAARKTEKEQKTPVGILTQKRKMLTSAKSRASKRGIPFKLTLDDFDIPATCPVLGIEIVLGGSTNSARENAPSLDRVVPLLGYVRGNVIVISFRANRIKNDATVTELEQVAEFYRNHMSNEWMVPNGID